MWLAEQVGKEKCVQGGLGAWGRASGPCFHTPSLFPQASKASWVQLSEHPRLGREGQKQAHTQDILQKGQLASS